MGHYLADLMCDTCSELRCTCAPAETKKKDPWLIDEEFSVVRVREYAKAQVGLARHLFKRHFDEKSDAKAEAKRLLDEAIKSAEERLVALKARRARIKAKK